MEIQSSIYGSLKSLRSSNTAFGSCLSTTDTIGSFRTAFSGSLSTLYFSAKSEFEEGKDTDTLNWTMNYDNFDELSDTSTLVGEDLAENISETGNPSLCGSDNQDIVNFVELTREEHSSMESQDICPHSPNISSCQTLNEENIRYQDYDLAVENKNEIQSSHGQSLITREQDQVQFLVDFPCTEDAKKYQVWKSKSMPKPNQPQIATKSSNRKIMSYIKLSYKSCSSFYNYLLIIAGSLASVAGHIMLKKSVISNHLSNWNLIFWRSLFQVLISVIFIIMNRKRGLPLFPITKYHLISGCLTFVGAMFMLDISHKNLLSSQTCTAFYLSLPLIIFLMEHLCHKRFIFYPAVSVLLFLLWSLAIVAYLLPNSQEEEIQEKFLSSSGVQTRTWHINLMDGVFAWPISVSNRIYKSESLLGYALATLALITSASSLMVPTFDKIYSWPWFLLWQAIGGLLAASLGLVSIEGWPKWYYSDWWFPLLLSLIGTFVNFSLVKVIITPLNSQDSGSKVPLTTLIVLKISTEALILLVFDLNNSYFYETNVILTIILLSICFIVACFCPNKSI